MEIFPNTGNVLQPGQFSLLFNLRFGQSRIVRRCVTSLADLFCNNVLLQYVYGDNPAILLLWYSETGFGVLCQLGIEMPSPHAPLFVCLHYDSSTSFTVCVTRWRRIEAYERLQDLKTRLLLPWFIASSATTCGRVVMSSFVFVFFHHIFSLPECKVIDS